MQDKPKMDINLEDGGVSAEIIYTGNIVISTKEEYARLKQKAVCFDKEKKDWEVKEGDYKLEIQRLKNQLQTQEQNHERALRNLRVQANQRMSEQEKQAQRANLLLERQGKGRPSLLTDDHKNFIEKCFIYAKTAILVNALGKYIPLDTATDYQTYLTYEMGYTGGYEPVRAFVAEMKQKYPRKF